MGPYGQTRKSVIAHIEQRNKEHEICNSLVAYNDNVSMGTRQLQKQITTYVLFVRFYIFFPLTQVKHIPNLQIDIRKERSREASDGNEEEIGAER